MCKNCKREILLQELKIIAGSDKIEDYDFHQELNSEDDNCLCTTNIYYRYEIINKNNNIVVGPIGSTCIDLFFGDNNEKWNNIKKYKQIKSNKVKGGKYKGWLYEDLYPSILKWFYYECNSNKPYIKEMKLYYKFKYIDGLDLKI